jgi:hypothetical protein
MLYYDFDFGLSFFLKLCGMGSHFVIQDYINAFHFI